MTDQQRAGPAYPIESVDRALRLLQILEQNRSLPLSRAAGLLGASPSTTHRLIAMFVHHGYVAQDPTSREYVAGPALVRLGLSVLNRTTAVDQVRPVMAALARQLDETVHLVVLDGLEVSFVDGVESRKALRVGSRVGVWLPAHATSAGKALLAEMSEERLLAVYRSEQLAARTDRTVTTRAALLAELARVRSTGYAINIDESEVGISSVAAVYRSPLGLPPVAVAVSAPTARIDEAGLHALARDLREAMDEHPATA
jgi:IclR family transcriptional regulator, acetate operon repressor